MPVNHRHPRLPVGLPWAAKGRRHSHVCPMTPPRAAHPCMPHLELTPAPYARCTRALTSVPPPSRRRHRGGFCYHRRLSSACRRRVGGLWSQNPPLSTGQARAAQCPELGATTIRDTSRRHAPRRHASMNDAATRPASRRHETRRPAGRGLRGVDASTDASVSYDACAGRSPQRR